MTNSEIEARLLEIVRDYKHLGGPALTHSTVLADLGIDSLDALNILFAVEEEFDISIPDERARATKTVGDLIDVVSALVPAVQ